MVKLPKDYQGKGWNTQGQLFNVELPWVKSNGVSFLTARITKIRITHALKQRLPRNNQWFGAQGKSSRVKLTNVDLSWVK